ncbi:MAG: tRNA (guanosine(46)-N7)-methyltransferase TrmB, partial [Gammaproteobacteria bacterium]
MTEQRRQRHVRSFVRRQGRLTKGQQRAYGDMWPLVGVDLPDQAERLRDMAGLFGREAQRTLEIGFGNGDTLAEMALAMPERDFIGVEVHRPGVGHLCMRIQDGEISNLRVLCHDAVELVRDYLPAQSLDAVHIYFPDPWHKTRHHKRRIVNPKFVDLLAKLVRPGGYLHLATDWR